MIERDWTQPLNLEIADGPKKAKVISDEEREAINEIMAEAAAEKPLLFEHFCGAEYKTMGDHHRLKTQLLRVLKTMAGGQWRTLTEIAELTGDPTPSISAQLRHLKKPMFGSHEVQRRPRGNREKGLFEYRLVLNWKHSDIFGRKEAWKQQQENKSELQSRQ